MPAGRIESGGAADAAELGAPPPPGPFESGSFESGVVLTAVDEGRRPYRVRAPHPIAQFATRAGLWGAVVLGAVGGVVGLVRPPVQQVEAVADDGLEHGSVPAPVAGIAELVVETWLTADDDDDDDRAALATLFLDLPDLDDMHLAALTIEHVATVAGEQRSAGYWAVTVAADVVEEVAVEGDGPDDEQTIEQLRATWYVEVAIVGEVDGRLVALSTPAVVPAPGGEVADWRASLDTPGDPGEGALAETVEGFLGALLAGGGDPARYLAPGGDIEAVDPSPFVAVELLAMAAEDYEDGQTRVLAEILVTTPGGTRTRLTYELVLGQWADRWEITRFAGAPSVVIAPPETGPEGDEDPHDDADADEPTGTTAGDSTTATGPDAPGS